jgi:hypothetical protein
MGGLLVTQPIDLWVAFAGHRESDRLATSRALETALQSAFNLISDAGEFAVIYPYELRLNLLTGYAPGADRRASGAWSQLEIGHQHFVFPFGSVEDLDQDTGWTDDPRRIDIDAIDCSRSTYGLTEEGFSCTILDGGGCMREQVPRNAHLDQSRWLIRHCEVLVVVWDGSAPSHVGGTADSVRLALTRGIPIVWIEAASCITRLIDPAELLDDTSLLEICDAYRRSEKGDGDNLEAFAAKIDQDNRVSMITRLAARLQGRLMPPWLQTLATTKVDVIHESHERRSFVARALSYLGILEPQTHHIEAPDTRALDEASFLAWQSERAKVEAKMVRAGEDGYHSRWIKWFVGWRNRKARPLRPLGVVWPLLAKFKPSSEAQDENIPPKPMLPGELDRDFDLSDKIALIASSRNRMIQIWLLRLALLAVGFGVFPAFAKEFWPHQADGIKIFCVLVEMALLLVMVGLHKFEGRSARHVLWSDARRLGERLRTIQATWAVGVDAGDGQAAPVGTWTEWYAQTLLRAVGPPKGRLTCERQLEAAKYGEYALIASQVGYHKNNASRMHTMHHRMEWAEQAWLWSLVAFLATFASWYFLSHSGTHGAEAHETMSFLAGIRHLVGEKPHWLGGALLMASAIVPAIGAVSIALESQLEVSASARRSQALLPRFEELAAEMAETLGVSNRNPSPTRAAEILRAAARLSVADVDSWRNDLERRRVIRGP